MSLSNVNTMTAMWNQKYLSLLSDGNFSEVYNVKKVKFGSQIVVLIIKWSLLGGGVSSDLNVQYLFNTKILLARP